MGLVMLIGMALMLASCGNAAEEIAERARGSREEATRTANIVVDAEISTVTGLAPAVELVEGSVPVVV